MGISALPLVGNQAEFIDYKVFTAQIALVGHLKLIKKHLKQSYNYINTSFYFT
jgi:hypothetical protein